MNQKILSAAIAGALAGSMAFAANADVTLYGQVDLSLDYLDVDNMPAGLVGDDINMNSNQSAIGVKGSEDLGNGLKAIFLLEYQIDPSGSDSAASGFGGRDQWVGLQGGFGKVRFGTMSTTYKSSGAMIDPFYRTSFQGRMNGLQSDLHLGAGANGEGRATNAIGYDTPDFNGLSGALTYSFDDQCDVGTVSATCADDDSYSLGARYKNGPALVFVDYVTSDQGGSDDAWKVGGKYGFGDITVYGQYEKDGGLIANGVPGDSSGANNEGADVWHLAASYTMGNAMIYGAYGQGDDDDAVGNTEYDTWTIAGMYNFSKRTMTYAGYTQVSEDCAGCGDTDHFGLGIRHKF
ncbi:MAG: porin [Gammaproteobacteria bacterium]|nr:porin [Gammaproteobacteria bacterium]